MSRFLLTTLRSGADALRAGLPLGGDTTGIREATDNSGELYHAVLDSPVRYRGADIHQVILRAAHRGQAPHFGMRGFAVEIAPITDPALRTAEVIDPASLEFVALGEIDDASDSVSPPPVVEIPNDPSPTAAAEERPLKPPRPPAEAPAASEEKASKKPFLVAAAAAGVIAAGVATVWLTSHDDNGDRPAVSTSDTPTATVAAPTRTSPTAVAPVEKPETVLRLVPPGYKPGACSADASVPVGALAAVTCTRNADPGGPESGRYTLFSDKAALQARFNQVVADSTQQICPGRIMSPGPWRHNATPDVPAGILFCGGSGDRSLIAWTDDAKLLLAVVDSKGQTAMEEMFAWWSTHS